MCQNYCVFQKALLYEGVFPGIPSMLIGEKMERDGMFLHDIGGWDT
jgi:hypothetical protein